MKEWIFFRTQLPGPSPISLTHPLCTEIVKCWLAVTKTMTWVEACVLETLLWAQQDSFNTPNLWGGFYSCLHVTEEETEALVMLMTLLKVTWLVTSNARTQTQICLSPGFVFLILCSTVPYECINNKRHLVTLEMLHWKFENLCQVHGSVSTIGLEIYSCNAIVYSVCIWLHPSVFSGQGRRILMDLILG